VVFDKMKEIFNLAKEGKITKKQIVDEAYNHDPIMSEETKEKDLEILDDQTNTVNKIYDADIKKEKTESITEVRATDDVKQTKITEDEADQIKNPSNYDSDYLEHSPEAVGFPNREEQWNTYRTVVGFIPSGESILDFGCARGDFERFYQTEYKQDLDYVGIDMNKQLIDASKKVYKSEVDVRCEDWFKLDSNLKKDWCINIGSCDLRYDADIKKDDDEYMQSTIESMYNHANKGIIVILASDRSETKDDGLINRNAGDVLNWAQKKFGTTALDHTVSNDVFVLIIYKN